MGSDSSTGLTARIVATAAIEQVAVDVLLKFGEYEVAPDTSDEALLARLDRTIGIVVRGEGRAPATVIEQAKDLKVIGRPGAGYNNVDIAAATARGIPVVYAPTEGSRAVAEGAMAMLLALVKKLSFWDRSVKSGDWGQRYEEQCLDMEGATLGIVGLGRIGSDLARLAKPWRMTVLGADPVVKSDDAAKLGVELVSVEELVARSDYISVHVPLTDETRGLVGGELLGHLKPGAILVNTARGAVVESLDVLLEALEDGRLGAVGLDTFAPEPPDIKHPIFKHPCCLTAPHAIGIAAGSWERICLAMAEDMAAVLCGRRPKNIVNPEVLKK